MPPIRSYLKPALKAVRANLVPGLLLQAFALGLVVSYFKVESVGAALEEVGRWKVALGYGYSIVSTALFGGLLPFLVLWLSRRIRTGQALSELVFYLLFWAWKGIEIDTLYRIQTGLFGDAATFVTIAQKTLVDQIAYNVLWAAPVQTLFFLWKDAGFSVEATRARLVRVPFMRRMLVVLFSTWIVWVPAVAIIYALPSALQLPISNLVLCFWCLLLSFLSNDDEAAPLEAP